MISTIPKELINEIMMHSFPLDAMCLYCTCKQMQEVRPKYLGKPKDICNVFELDRNNLKHVISLVKYWFTGILSKTKFFHECIIYAIEKEYDDAVCYFIRNNRITFEIACQLSVELRGSFNRDALKLIYRIIGKSNKESVMIGLAKSCEMMRFNVVEDCFNDDMVDIGEFVNRISRRPRMMVDLYDNIKLNEEYMRHMFMAACEMGYDYIVEELMEDVDVEDGFEKACMNGRINIAKMLYPLIADEYSGDAVFSNACGMDNIDIVKIMIEFGYNNFDDGFYYACSRDSVKVVELLLDICTVDFDDGLVTACRNGCKKVVEIILNAGVKFPHTALTSALENGHADIANMVAEYIKQHHIIDN